MGGLYSACERCLTVDDEARMRDKVVPVLCSHPVVDIAIRTLPKACQPQLSDPALENDEAPQLLVLPWVSTETGKALLALQLVYPFVAWEGHYLYARYKACERAVAEKRIRTASKILCLLQQEALMEEDTVSVVYNIFKRPGTDCFYIPEVHQMLVYLGWPSEKEHAVRFFDVLRKSDVFEIGVMDFHEYIGRAGGSLKVFEVRRSALGREKYERKGLLAPDEDVAEVARLQEELKVAGFADSEMTYWRLMLPLSECRAVGDLKPCQKVALQNIRSVARRNHERALPNLQLRVKKFGFEKHDLWMALAWIREIAPIIIQLNLDYMCPPMNTDTHYRNQFETGSSGGRLNLELRRAWERDLFCSAYEAPDVTPFDRVKYGVLNVMNDYRGVARTEMYGDSYFVMKDVRLRCTFAPEDSANLKVEKLAVIDYFAHQLLEYTDAELKEVLKVATASDSVIGNSCVITHLKYKEAQIHGEICFAKHIDRLVAHDRHNTGYMPKFLDEICAKHGLKLTWLSDEKKRAEQERRQRLSPRTWRKTLNAFASKHRKVAENRVPNINRKVATNYSSGRSHSK